MKIVVYRVVKSGVEIVVNTADIIDKDKDIYIYLFNIYKELIKKSPKKFIEIMSDCKKDENYLKMSEGSKEKLFYALAQVK